MEHNENLRCAAGGANTANNENARKRAMKVRAKRKKEREKSNLQALLVALLIALLVSHPTVPPLGNIAPCVCLYGERDRERERGTRESSIETPSAPLRLRQLFEYISDMLISLEFLVIVCQHFRSCEVSHAS